MIAPDVLASWRRKATPGTPAGKALLDACNEVERLTERPELTDEDYTAAIEKIDAVYGQPAAELMELIESVRDEEIVHFASLETGRCVEDCAGCLAERIGDAIARTVNGGDR
jgi:hypothetical protein